MQNEDVGLQRAIYASLQGNTTSRSFPSLKPSPSSSYRAPPLHSSRSSFGRVNSLKRDKILPASNPIHGTPTFGPPSSSSSPKPRTSGSGNGGDYSRNATTTPRGNRAPSPSRQAPNAPTSTSRDAAGAGSSSYAAPRHASPGNRRPPPPTQMEAAEGLRAGKEAIAEGDAPRGDRRGGGSDRIGRSVTVPALMPVDPSEIESLATQVAGVTIPAGHPTQVRAPSAASAPLPPYLDNLSLEERSLAHAIEGEIVSRSPGVAMSDISGLDAAKRALHESCVLPLMCPELFQGPREPWRGILLFGPPGTGKTLLARAVASQCGATFFNCSVATLVSKWRGESEKLVRVLYHMARHYAPSVVFFDEIDALVPSRGLEGEHEASRRFKCELLAQMDGLLTSAPPGGWQDGAPARSVITLATTNRPWDLDEALVRRMEKRIHVPLPDAAAREGILRVHLRGAALSTSADAQLSHVAAAAEGYSGSDLRTVSREASMAPVRRALAGRSLEEIQKMREGGQLSPSGLEIRPEDLRAALAAVQPSVAKGGAAMYDKWAGEFGSV